MIEIIPYADDYAAEIGPFINAIQRNEFGVPITLADQPDLADIPNVYLKGNGNFWVASVPLGSSLRHNQTNTTPLGSSLRHNQANTTPLGSSLRHNQTNTTPLGSSLRGGQTNQLIGTIALIDAGDGIGVIRKMFVAKEYRGAPHRVGQRLFDTLLAWASERSFSELQLGTVDKLKAAHRFYEKNGFTRIPMDAIHPSVDKIKMPHDNIYYTRRLNSHAHAA